MTASVIRSAFFGRLTAYGGVFDAKPVLWPGVSQKPPESGQWLEPKLFPNEPAVYGWELNSQVLHRGFFQILVGFRPGRGEGEAIDTAQRLARLFPYGFHVSQGIRVSQAPTLGPTIYREHRAYVPLTIPYLGFNLPEWPEYHTVVVGYSDQVQPGVDFYGFGFDSFGSVSPATLEDGTPVLGIYAYEVSGVFGNLQVAFTEGVIPVSENLQLTTGGETYALTYDSAMDGADLWGFQIPAEDVATFFGEVGSSVLVRLEVTTP